VRSTAFRSTLRYWFRALALGVLPNQQVRDLEMEIFGGIEPEPHTGLFRLEIPSDRIIRDNAQQRHQDFGLAKGALVLRNSSQTANLPDRKREALPKVLQNLTWLMFHLGGVGQGSRRPCYSRENRPYAPWWRGATLIAESDDEFWQIPDNVTELRRTFRQRLQAFYTALEQFSEAARPINFRQPRAVLSPPTQQNWVEAVDSCCRIVCVTGNSSSLKPFALDVLHQVGHMGGGNYDRYLCGATAIPSPVWISALGDCQVATVFGVTESSQNPRSKYLSQLREQTTRETYSQIWPFA
jgi:CRISPR-associated protein Cmr6